jgi:ATP-dependent Clp protease ATP-binding subunit ClpB
MNNEQFTLKANQAVQDSVRLAAEHGNQEVVPLHLALAILAIPENIVSETIKKIGVDLGQLERDLDKELAALPKVEGAEPYLGHAVKKAIAGAAAIAGQFRDEYLST